MKTVLLLFLTLFTFATPANAQISRPNTLANTLTLLAQAFRDAPEIRAVTVNRSDLSLGFARDLLIFADGALPGSRDFGPIFSPRP